MLRLAPSKRGKKAELPYVELPDVGYWKTEIDRSRDFLAVFGGESTRDQGLRVYEQIRRWCSPASFGTDADKPGTLAFKEGRRSILREIDTACRPDRQRVPEIERTPNVA